MAATYRQVYVTFWADNFIMELSPEEKLFYIYLLTNQYVSFCGIYVLTIKMMARDTKLTPQKIKKMLKMLSEKGKVAYSELTDEICLCNWLSYNSAKSPTQIKGFSASLEMVKDRNLLKYLKGLKVKGHTLSDTVCHTMPDTVPDRVSDTVWHTKEQEQEQEQENKSSSNARACSNERVNLEPPKGEKPAAAIDFDFLGYFAKKYPIPNTTWRYELIALGEEYPQVWLERATEEFLLGNATSLKYLQAILQRWQTVGGAEPWNKQKPRGQPRAGTEAAAVFEREHPKPKKADPDCPKCKGEGRYSREDEKGGTWVEICDCWKVVE